MQSIVLTQHRQGKTIQEIVEVLNCPFCRSLLVKDVKEFRPLYNMFTGEAEAQAMANDLQDNVSFAYRRIAHLQGQVRHFRNQAFLAERERDRALDQVSDRELERSGWHSDDGADPDYVPGPGRRQRRRLNANVRQI